MGTEFEPMNGADAAWIGVKLSWLWLHSVSCFLFQRNMKLAPREGGKYQSENKHHFLADRSGFYSQIEHKQLQGLFSYMINWLIAWSIKCEKCFLNCFFFFSLCSSFKKLEPADVCHFIRTKILHWSINSQHVLAADRSIKLIDESRQLDWVKHLSRRHSRNWKNWLLLRSMTCDRGVSSKHDHFWLKKPPPKKTKTRWRRP